MNKKRIFYVDIIKAIALLFVISVHSLGHIGYYSTNIGEHNTLILTCLRSLWVCCVPMFLIATGLLQGTKEPSMSHYLGILRFIIVYLLVAILCVLLGIVNHVNKGIEIDYVSVLTSFINFQAAPYGWYVAMFCGLYMLIPYINRMWKILDGQEKKVLLLILFILTILPNTLNSLNFQSKNFLCASRNEYTIMADTFWIALYPVFYYCVGVFIREKEDILKNLSLPKLLVYTMFVIVSFGFFNYFRYNGVLFGWANDISYGGPQAFVASLLLVLALQNVGSKLQQSTRYGGGFYGRLLF